MRVALLLQAAAFFMAFPAAFLITSSARSQAEVVPAFRIRSAFAWIPKIIGDPLLEQAAWSKSGGARFIAKICVAEPHPRLGCRGGEPGQSAIKRSTSRIDERKLHRAARDLDGAWHGVLYELTIDTTRAQAKAGRPLPFDWRRFVPKEVGDGTLLFVVGSALYEAALTERGLLLIRIDTGEEHHLERAGLIFGAHRTGSAVVLPSESHLPSSHGHNPRAGIPP